MKNNDGRKCFSGYIFCTIITLPFSLINSMESEYVVRSFLPDSVFLPRDHGLDF